MQQPDSDPRCAICAAPLHCGGGLDQLCPVCLFEGAKQQVPTAREVGTDLDALRPHFPDLELIRVIGRGGMGVVLEARQVRLDRRVAVKLLAPHHAADHDFAARFEREAQALARLSHPSIVGVHDFGESGGRYFLILEFVDGVNVRELIRDGRMSTARALEVVPQICAALEYAHGQGVVHRDIKPENILLDRDGRVQIADFGLAKLVGTSDIGMTRASDVMGTPGYMAPEQISRPLAVDHRADIFALGVVLYEMLTGEVPQGRFAPPSQKVPVDGRVDGVVLRAMAEEPGDRYQAVSELSADVLGLGPATSSTSYSASPTMPVGSDDAFALRGEMRWLAVVPFGALPVVAASVVGAWTWILIGSGLGDRIHREWIALAYPFAFLGLVAVRSAPLRSADAMTRRMLVSLGALGSIAAGVLTSRSSVDDEVELLGITAACSVLLGAHLMLDRWLRRAESLDLVLAGGLLFLASAMYGSLRSHGPEGGISFAVGMSAILCGASLLTMIPELSIGEPGPRLRAALMRATLMGAGLGTLYFREMIFG